jgi:hypothetical protein
MIDRWLVLIHQLPPEPAYLRVKVARRLQRIGAVAIKNTVYVLPATDQALEDMQWTIAEIRAGGGEANLCESRFVDGLTSGDLQQRFNDARAADYAPLLAEARALAKKAQRGRRRENGARASRPPAAGRLRPAERAPAARQETAVRDVPRLAGGTPARLQREELAKLAARAEEVQAIDFFGAPDGQTLAALLGELAAQLQGGQEREAAPAGDYRGRVWVTRAGVHVDRMASAWLIRRFIDPDATFKFVSGKSHEPLEGEIRFDMFDAEVTHEGDRCTFEVLRDRMGLDDPALRAIAEVVHDIDLRDEKFRRPETAGIALVVNGIALTRRDDDERLRQAAALLDEVYAAYRRKR